MPSNPPLASSKTSLSVRLWRQMIWDRTPVLPLSVVVPWSGVYLCPPNQMEEALGWERGERGWFGDMVLEAWVVAAGWRSLCGGHGGSSLRIILRDKSRLRVPPPTPNINDPYFLPQPSLGRGEDWHGGCCGHQVNSHVPQFPYFKNRIFNTQRKGLLRELRLISKTIT